MISGLLSIWNLHISSKTQVIKILSWPLCIARYLRRQLYIFRKRDEILRNSLSPIVRIQILTYLIWGILGAAIFDCVIRSCDLFDWFIRTCFGPTVIPAVITSLELFCVLTMCYFSDNVSSKKILKYYG